MPPESYETTVLGRLADRAFRRRGRVVAAWLAALALAIAAAATLGGDHVVDYATPGSDSKAAVETLQREFDGRQAQEVQVVYRADTDATTRAVTAKIDGLLRDAGRLEGLQPGVTTKQAEISKDGYTGVVRVPLDRLQTAVPESTGEHLRELGERADGAGLQVAFGGEIDGLDEAQPAPAEAIGVAVALVILLLTFGSAVAAGLPLLTALFGVGAAVALGGVVAAAIDTPDWAPQVAIMLGLGVGIDYALLILTRQRAAMRADGKSPHAATIEALATAGRSVLVAGGTVVISLLGMFLMRLPYLYGVALAASLAVLIVVAAALTLLPALLGFAGHRIERLRIPGAGRAPSVPENAPAARWARGVQARPWPAAILSTLLLVALALPVTGVRYGFPDAGNNREGTTTRAAYEMLADGFGPGANGPLLAVVETERADARAAAAQIRADVADAPGVATVAAPRVAPDGRTALIAITPTTSPQSERTRDLIDHLRDGPLARSDARVLLGGMTANVADQGDATASRLPLFIAAVIGLSFLLLLGAFRAPVVALKAGVMNLLSIGAAFGVVALVAEGGWAGQLIGIDTNLPVPPFIPVMMFAILFGLSMDYEVFLMSAIREQRDRGAGAQEAVVAGVARTARVITAAAAIMVAVFAAFALDPEVFIKLIGVGLATAILIDATIVRMILVPAVMALLGDRAWWTPGRRQSGGAIEPSSATGMATLYSHEPSS